MIVICIHAVQGIQQRFSCMLRHTIQAKLGHPARATGNWAELFGHLTFKVNTEGSNAYPKIALRFYSLCLTTWAFGILEVAMPADSHCERKFFVCARNEDEKHLESAVEKMWSNWTRPKLLRGRFGAFFFVFRAIFRFGVKSSSGKCILQRCFPKWNDVAKIRMLSINSSRQSRASFSPGHPSQTECKFKQSWYGFTWTSKGTEEDEYQAQTKT